MDRTAQTSGRPSTPQADQPASEWTLSKAAREVRLGLVLYGGVSLAIYINGVADELFRAVRGRGIYKLLKRLIDSDIVLDIISGTSAGGINGLFLAYALTNEREFSDCARLWREHGSLAKLLRLIDDDMNATSLLDSKNFYVPQLEAAFRSMGQIDGKTLQAERPSRLDELDLFVTGTNYDGRLSTAIDATGRQIDIKSHRTVFHLKHRAGRKTPFAFAAMPEDRTPEDRARVAALARLAAITSCFPAAFEPVKVAPGKPGTQEDDVYGLLRQWGALDGETWFLDGGVLDNKPFSYTIREIFNRTASRPVDRKLFYVEPDPERFKLSARPARTTPPSAVQSTVQALFGIPGYESIAEDLHQIMKRNNRLERLTRAREAAERALDDVSSPGQLTDRTISPATAAIYRHTRLTQLSTRAVLGLMENETAFHRSLHGGEGRRSKDEREEDQRGRETAKALAQAFNTWNGSGDDTLERYDVYLRRRRLLHVIYRVFGHVSHLCNTALANADAVAKAQSLQEFWKKLNRQLGAYDIVQWAMESTLDAHAMPKGVAHTPGAATEVWQMLEEDLDDVLRVDDATNAACDGDHLSEDQLKALHEELKRRVKPYKERQERSNGGPPVTDGVGTRRSSMNLLQRLDDQTRRLVERAPHHQEVAKAWANFEWYDAHFFPIDYFGDLGEKDPIDVVRVSPIDAERAFSRRTYEDKITGETVMHFGAFLKKSWRSNDIMWGRLDGACRILDELLKKPALERAVSNEEVRRLLREDLAGELDPLTLFPHAGGFIQNDVRAWLHDLASEDLHTRERALGDDHKYELLLWCAQLEILHQDLPNVLEDAVTEQLEWNSVRTERGFKAMGVRLDRATARVIGKQATRDFIDTLRNDPSEFNEIPNAPIAKYFLKDYSVGAETVRQDIPPAVLVETMTTASLVARNCLLKAFPEQGDKLRSNLLYKALVQWPLTTAHTLAVFARRERAFYLGGMAALFTYALAALVGGVVWLGVDISPGERIDNIRLVTLVVVPLIILVVGGYMAWLHVMRHIGRAWSSVLAAAALFYISLLTLTPVALALVASWQATNDTLREWFANAPTYDWAHWLFPSPFLRWLAASVQSDAQLHITLYPLAALLIILVIVVPMARGFIQSRVARRTAGFAIDDTVRSAMRKCTKIASAAAASVQERLGQRQDAKLQRTLD